MPPSPTDFSGKAGRAEFQRKRLRKAFPQVDFDDPQRHVR
jgi:hypothetical protein